MSAHMNGGWPELPPIPPAIEDLPPNATPIQVMRALGSTLIMFGQLWPRVVQALEYLKRRVDQGPPLPPMRSPEDSFMGQVPELQELKNRVRDPNDRRFTSDYVRAMVRNTLDGSKRDEKAARYDALVKTSVRVLVGVAVGVLVAMTLAHFGLHP